MVFHNIGSNWRLKWGVVIDGKATGEICYTWHSSEAEAETFLVHYMDSLPKPLTGRTYVPLSEPKRKPNLFHSPLGQFVQGKKIHLAPLA